MSEFVRCVGCGEIVEAQEPCSCVFDVVGTLDAQGVLHTAERLPVRFAVPCCCCEQIFEPDPEQIDAWGRSGRNFDPTDWVCQACEAAEDAALERIREIEERAWLETERAAERATQQFVSQLPRADPTRPRETVEQQVRGAIFDMAKGKDVSRAFR